MIKQALIIFTKNPESGRVKTRIAATIGNEAALAIYHQLLLHTISITWCLPVNKFIFYSDYIEPGDVWNADHYFKEVQQGVDLGERMKNAFAILFQKGYDRIVIIGSDCPTLTSEIIMNAFVYLQTHNIILGPAEDGGYYLLGMKRLYPDFFENLQWSTNTVLIDTLKRCDKLELTYQLLPILNDVDEAKDWEAFKLQKQ